MSLIEKIALELQKRYPGTYQHLSLDFIVQCVDNGLDFAPNGWEFVKYSTHLQKDWDNFNNFIVQNYIGE